MTDFAKLSTKTTIDAAAMPQPSAASSSEQGGCVSRNGSLFSREPLRYGGVRQSLNFVLQVKFIIFVLFQKHKKSKTSLDIPINLVSWNTHHFFVTKHTVLE